MPNQRQFLLGEVWVRAGDAHGVDQENTRHQALLALMASVITAWDCGQLVIIVLDSVIPYSLGNYFMIT